MVLTAHLKPVAPTINIEQFRDAASEVQLRLTRIRCAARMETARSSLNIGASRIEGSGSYVYFVAK
jgi:hypothetical protein